METLPHRSAGWMAAVLLWLLSWSLILSGCATTPSAIDAGGDGRRVGVLSLLGDQLQVAGVGEVGRSHTFVDIGAWRIDRHVEQYARRIIRSRGRAEVVDINMDREVSKRLYADCDGSCDTRAPTVRVEALRTSLSRWRRDKGLDHLVLFVRSDNRQALLGPLVTSTAGVGLGLIPGSVAVGRSTTVFAYVQAIVIEAETGQVLATTGFFNNGFVDAEVPVPAAGHWPAAGGAVIAQAIRRQLESGVDVALEQLGLLEPVAAR